MAVDIPEDTVRPSSPTSSSYSNDTSASDPSDAYSFEALLSVAQSLETSKPSTDLEALVALPRRGNRPRRALAFKLATALYPDLTEIAAVIKYERLVTPPKAVARQILKEAQYAQFHPKNNGSGKLLRIQGPWLGQELDPIDLRGPSAIPMPVKIGSTEDFAPIFGFLAQNKAFDEAGKSSNGQATYGVEMPWKSPMVEFKRGIVYEDGRLDLCKKVVGPTHIGKLMESLDSNQHVRHFLLGNNAISTTGANAIANFIERHPDRMETWYLAGCHLTRHGLSLLAPQMIKSKTINNLWFKRNPFGPNSSSILTELVLKTKNLRTLDLETTELGDDGTRRFIEGITGQPTALRHLYLNANGIGASACASLGKFLADPHCQLTSLFLSTNPIGDAGMLLLAPGLAKNRTLKRFMCASAGLTSKGVSKLAAAFTDGEHPLHSLDLGASMTTIVHQSRYNFIDDDCINALRPLILSPNMRLLNFGRTALSETGLQEVRSIAEQSELVHLSVQRVQIATTTAVKYGQTDLHDTVPVVRSCSLGLHRALRANQEKHFPDMESHDGFEYSEEMRFLRNTSDVRQIDSMYRTRDKRLGLPMDEPWAEGDLTWKLIAEDAERWEAKAHFAY